GIGLYGLLAAKSSRDGYCGLLFLMYLLLFVYYRTVFARCRFNFLGMDIPPLPWRCGRATNAPTQPDAPNTLERSCRLSASLPSGHRMCPSTRPTSQAATAQPAPVKKQTQNQTPIKCGLMVDGMISPSPAWALRA